MLTFCQAPVLCEEGGREPAVRLFDVFRALWWLACGLLELFNKTGEKKQLVWIDFPCVRLLPFCFFFICMPCAQHQPGRCLLCSADPSVTLAVPMVMCFFAGIPPLRTVVVWGCVGGGGWMA
ncbi:hypothetical protein TcCL_ESM11538 [Trypanosoma cruzi]|nr:hypothetical protein TcCL_ESM11538 [Trypanosoma cruzi]